MKLLRALCTPLALTALSACAVEVPSGSGADDILDLRSGKEDNFLSRNAREYVVSGSVDIRLEERWRDASEAERVARAKELVGYKQLAVSWFLTQYLVTKKSDDANASYGGYGNGALAKINGDATVGVERVDELTYRLELEQVIAGDPRLLDLLPLRTRADGGHEFTLIVGKPSNDEIVKIEMNREWYRSAPWSSFNPQELAEDQKEELTLAIRPEVESQDAWFDYPALFADGVLDIDVHFGWDYHGDYHKKHAESLFDWLVNNGYRAPKDPMAFADLDHTSGAFTRSIPSPYGDVEVKVQIFYGKKDSANDPDTDEGGRQLEADMRESFRSRDVIIYSGHSGPFYGFALGNWRVTSEGDLDDSKIATLDLPEQRYQLIVAEGCDTYHIAEAFKRHPKKPGGAYLDVVTTTASSDAGSPRSVLSTIGLLTETQRDEHVANTVLELIRRLDRGSRWMNAMYGIHAIDDNSQLHPYADTDVTCMPCSRHADCGTLGNRCVRLDAGSVCAASCTTDAGCPDGYSCRGAGGGAFGGSSVGQCVPSSGACE